MDQIAFIPDNIVAIMPHNFVSAVDQNPPPASDDRMSRLEKLTAKLINKISQLQKASHSRSKCRSRSQFRYDKNQC